MIYNESNYTELFSNPLLQFNSTQELQMNLVNGTGRLEMGYVSSYCRIEGMDLLLQMELAILVFLVIITILLTLYVSLYVWRFIND